MFSSGVGPDGAPRVRATVCPIREIDPDHEAVIAWYLASVRFEPWTGRPDGSPEWPRPGGVLRQDARLVEAVNVIRAEIDYLPKQKSETKAPSAPKGRRKP